MANEEVVPRESSRRAAAVSKPNRYFMVSN